MRTIGAGPCEELTDPNEVFKYTGFGDCNYVLVAVISSDYNCDGCVFDGHSGHPLSSKSCAEIGLCCSKRIFKAIDARQ